MRYVSPHDKPLLWLRGEVKTPPFSSNARIEAGFLLRQLQRGESLSMPESRPMPTIGVRCHELRIRDKNHTWRIIYRTDPDAVIIVEVFDKDDNKTPKSVIDNSKKRLSAYDRAAKGERY
jgi:phage-related protein